MPQAKDKNIYSTHSKVGNWAEENHFQNVSALPSNRCRRCDVRILSDFASAKEGRKESMFIRGNRKSLDLRAERTKRWTCRQHGTLVWVERLHVPRRELNVNGKCDTKRGLNNCVELQTKPDRYEVLLFLWIVCDVEERLSIVKADGKSSRRPSRPRRLTDWSESRHVRRAEGWLCAEWILNAISLLLMCGCPLIIFQRTSHKFVIKQSFYACSNWGKAGDKSGNAEELIAEKFC